MDPGASSGLGGTDTKREYDQAKVPLCEDSQLFENWGATFTGIDGEPTKGLGMLAQNAALGRLTITLHVDLIGGPGSNCPFLFPLPPL